MKSLKLRIEHDLDLEAAAMTLAANPQWDPSERTSPTRAIGLIRDHLHHSGPVTEFEFEGWDMQSNEFEARVERAKVILRPVLET